MPFEKYLRNFFTKKNADHSIENNVEEYELEEYSNYYLSTLTLYGVRENIYDRLDKKSLANLSQTCHGLFNATDHARDKYKRKKFIAYINNSILTSLSYSIFKTIDNQFLFAGRDDFVGSYNNGKNTLSNALVQKLSGLKNVKEIKGIEPTLILDNNGLVWKYVDDTLQCIPIKNKIKQISVGNWWDDAFFLSTAGEVFLYDEDEDDPIKISGFNNIVQIQSVNKGVIGRKADGAIMVWGKNTHGELGMGHKKSIHDSAQTVPDIKNVREICSSTDTVFLILNNNSVMVCGRIYKWAGDFGQADLNDDNITKFILLPKLPPIKKIIVGEYDTVFLTTKGNVFSYVLYMKSDNINLNNIIHVAGDHNHFICVDIDGHVHGWGYNHYGQLPLTEKNIHKATKLDIRLFQPQDVPQSLRDEVSDRNLFKPNTMRQ